MNRKEIKEKLKAELPSGFISKVQSKLKSLDKPYSRGTISTVLNPESDYWNLDVINAAHDVVIDSRAKDNAVANKIARL